MMHLLARLAVEDSGQDLIEYAMLAAIVSLTTAALLRNTKNDLNNIFEAVGNALTSATS